MKKKIIPCDAKIPIKLSIRELEMIRDKTFCDPNYIKFAIIDDKNVKIKLSFSEIEDMQGYIAAEANHANNKKLQEELDRIYDNLQTYLDKYDEIN